MIDLEKVIREVSKRLNLDRNLVATVCKHPYQCVVEQMKDDEDTRDILLNNFMKLFKFKLKRRFKEDKTRQYTK